MRRSTLQGHPLQKGFLSNPKSGVPNRIELGLKGTTLQEKALILARRFLIMVDMGEAVTNAQVAYEVLMCKPLVSTIAI